MATYRRTYLVRLVEMWEFDPPVGLALDEDFVAFDEALVEHGATIDSWVETVDDDDLDIEAVNE